MGVDRRIVCGRNIYTQDAQAELKAIGKSALEKAVIYQADKVRSVGFLQTNEILKYVPSGYVCYFTERPALFIGIKIDGFKEIHSIDDVLDIYLWDKGKWRISFVPDACR